MELWWYDVRHALRRFAKQPMFTTVAIASLALGIGANVAIFGFTNTYLMARLPVPDASQLVRVYTHTDSRDLTVSSYPDYRDIRDGVAGLDLAMHAGTTAQMGEGTARQARRIELVSGNYFRVMQVEPIAGRLIGAQDDVAEGTSPVVVLGEVFWRAFYHGDPAVVGQTIRLNDKPYEVVGIAPASFRGAEGGDSVEMWAPVMMQQQLRPRQHTLDVRGWGWMSMIGRVQRGTSDVAIKAGLDRVGADISRRFPGKGPQSTYIGVPAWNMAESDRRALKPYLLLTTAFTGLLLLVTCANLAGVMQARVLARGRELAIRQSIGAGRGRLVSEWLTECVLLSLAGGAAGLAVAKLTLWALLHTPPPIPGLGGSSVQPPLDASALGFAALISIVAAGLFGLLPALRVAAAQPLSLLKEEAATSTGGRRGARLRHAAVLVQVAASAVLLLAAGLMGASLRNLQNFNVGFQTENVAMASVSVGSTKLSPAEGRQVLAEMLTRVRSVPGVTAAGAVGNVPITNNRDVVGFRIPGYTPPPGSTSVSIDMNVVSAGYFDALGISFVRGRAWSSSPGDAPSAVINETMAKQFWAGRDPIGEPIEFVGTGTLTVAGVVRDSVYYQVGESPLPYIYLPAEVQPLGSYTLVAHTSVPVENVLRSIGSALASADPRLLPPRMTTLAESRRAPLYPRRLLASTAIAFGLVALLLTAIGLYGVVSMSVGQRTREFGVRVALGATSSRVWVGVVRESAQLVAIGTLLGCAGAYALAGAMKHWLFGVAPFDLTVYGIVAGALSVIAIVAAWMPARKAAAVDPLTALRS
jgi:predicted permease